MNCYEGKSLGQPGAQGLALPQRAQLRGRQAGAERRSPTSASRRRAPRSCLPACGRTPTTTGSRRRTSCTRFDLAKAGQLLDEAGYELGPTGSACTAASPIELRLWTTTESAPAQTSLKLIAGWFKKLGLKIEVAVLDTGAMQDRVWNFEGDTYVPDFDMYIWDWAGYSDPGQTLSANDHRADRQHQRALLVERRVRRAQRRSRRRRWTPSQRKELIDRMQQIMYEQTPWVVLTYPQYLQAYNDAEVDRLGAHVRRRRAGVSDDRLPAVVHRPQAGGRRGRRAAAAARGSWWPPRPPWRRS